MAPPPTWLIEWSEIIAGFGTLVLTAALVILYRQQKELFAENHRGLLDAILDDVNGDGVNLKLTNLGNGVVTDLSL